MNTPKTAARDQLVDALACLLDIRDGSLLHNTPYEHYLDDSIQGLSDVLHDERLWKQLEPPGEHQPV